MEKFKPHNYQQMAIEKIYSTLRVGLFLDMGLGKTIITLTAINELIYNRFEVNKVLIIAPLRVAEDWLEMPDISYVDRIVKLSDEEMNRYLEFERKSYMDFIEGEVTAASAAALTNKLLQYSNGAMYLENGDYAHTSDKKLDVLDEIVDTAQGKPILCFYSFRHDLERIKARFPKAVKLKSSDDIEQWNKGNIQLLLAHPTGAGHGLNLQAGGNIIVWFGLTWSLELYQQANARLYRQGQKEKVIIHHLITEGTIDIEVLKSLQNKEEVQENLLNALKAKINRANKIIA